MTEREELLLRMYDQLFNDINRHIMVVWQSIGVLIGAFAIFALVEKNILSLDLAAMIVLLLCAWLIAHLYDAAYWYNRNLVIIANIEKQFLNKDDLRDIHYYFGAHRPKNKMIEHLSIQMWLGLGLGLIILIYHFFERVGPGLTYSFSDFEFTRALPYILVLVSWRYLYLLKINCEEKYQEFLSNSPGKTVDTQSINYGAGHAHSKKTENRFLKFFGINN
jgi:hypothetical protein